MSSSFLTWENEQMMMSFAELWLRDNDTHFAELKAYVRHGCGHEQQNGGWGALEVKRGT